MECFPPLPEKLFCRRMINDNRREGVVMQPKNFRTAKPLRRGCCIAHPHGEVISHTKSGETKRSHGGDQFHVMSQRGITAVIKGPLGGLHAKSSGLPPIAAIRHAAGMNRRRVGHAPKIKTARTAGVHWMYPAQPLGGEPLHHLEVTDQKGTALQRDLFDIGNMVSMTVRN